MYTITITKNGESTQLERDSLISGDMGWYSGLPCGKAKPSIRVINDTVAIDGIYETHCNDVILKVERNGKAV